MEGSPSLCKQHLPVYNREVVQNSICRFTICEVVQSIVFSPHTITYYRPSPPLHPVYGKAITGRGALRGT